ncbi:ABC transporter permease [soil metagenome]
MLKNYFKIAWRNLFRNKGFSLTNLLGLTIGMTCALLILMWVNDELGYNRFHANYHDIYHIRANRDFNKQIFMDENMVLPLASEIEKNIPQISQAVVTTGTGTHILANGEVKLKKEGYTVSDHFFDIFSWKFVKGNAQSALPDAYSIVLTQSAAKALFGDADPINKTVRVDNEYNAKVTAIVEDVPGNSSLKFDFVNGFNYSNDYLKKMMTNWQSSSWYVYIRTMPGANIQSIEKNINKLKYEHDPGDKKVSTYFAFPMSKWRLYNDFKNGVNTGGMIEYVRLFSIIAIIILLIACVNFMNLSTARSEKRAKEVGIRKTLGSGRKQLVIQFFCESMILACMAFALSMIAVVLLLPSFNVLVDKQLVLNISQPLFWISAMGVILFTGLVAGSYPALYLSSFNPVKVLKGTFLPGKKAIMPRRILVVSQFVMSILLISATIIVYQQIQHIKSRDIGYNPNNLIMIEGSADSHKNFGVIKHELMQTGNFESVTRTMSPITDIWWRSPAPGWPGKPANTEILFSGLTTDVDFTKTMGIKLLDGKDFSGSPSDSASVLMNKAAADVMGSKNLVGTSIDYGKKFTVIGITGNVIMESPFAPVEPMMIFFDPANSNSISVRLKQHANIQVALKSLGKIFRKYDPSVPFDYKFVDKEFGKKFLTEELISKLTNIFAGLAIFICCLGLAGLASFTIEKRIREIGIRKVLGATVKQLLFLISKEFLKLVLIAFLIAVPLTWWVMSDWLKKYQDRIDISVWMFGLLGLGIMLLTLFVVSMNTMKAAMRSPVKSLRTE